MNLSPQALNALKIAGAVVGTTAVGFGVYKGVQHFKNKQEQQSTTQAIAPSQAQVTPTFESTPATQLTTYPQFISTTFPNLQIREGCVFEADNMDYMLIEGVDVKNRDNPRQQAILFVLENSNYSMVSSVTVDQGKASYNHKRGNVYIGYQNGGNVQSFTGSGHQEPIANFNNDFVIAQ